MVGMSHDGICDFNRFHPSSPPCRARALWVTDEAKLPCGEHELLRAVMWCDEHRHESDRRLDEKPDAVAAAGRGEP